MKGLLSLFLGICGTFAFSWVGLVFVPNIQIGHLEPQTDEDGTDIYPMPESGMVERGRQVYAANGCVYCHSQQIRPDFAGSDLDRTRDNGPEPRVKWGERRSAPRDYIFDRPVLLGKMRMGPDLANIGHATPASASESAPAPNASPATSSPAPGAVPASSPAAASPSPIATAAASPPVANPSPAAGQAPAPNPAAGAELPNDGSSALAPYSAAWHHRHLYNPRSMTLDSKLNSIMPAYRFLYEKHQIGSAPSDDALDFSDDPQDAPPSGWEIIPTYDAQCLVEYLMSLDQSHPLKEVKGAAPSAPSAPVKQAK